MSVRFPCESKSNCSGSDDPLANLTAEGFDQRMFFSIIYGSHWHGRCCNMVCTSFDSQQAADNCAAATALLAEQGGCDVTVHSDGSIGCADSNEPDGSTNPIINNPPGPPSNPNCPSCVPPIRFVPNDPQNPPTRNCTGGWIFEYLQDTSAFGRSAEEANRIAESLGLRQADLSKFCCTPTNMIFCLDVSQFLSANHCGRHRTVYLGYGHSAGWIDSGSCDSRFQNDQYLGYTDSTGPIHDQHASHQCEWEHNHRSLNYWGG